MMRRPRALATGITVVLTVVLLGMAGCGGGDDDSSAPTTEAETGASDGDATTTTAALTPEEQAMAAYRTAYDTYFKALNPPNPQSPDLPTVFSGEALSTIIDTVFRAKNEGVYVVGSLETHPAVVSSTVDEVILTDCQVETNQTFDAATNQPKDSGTYTYNSRITVRNADGAWKVAAFEQVEEPCTPAPS